MTPRGRPLSPEEELAAEVLRRIFEGATVTQHDDGTAPSMYDLTIRGSTTGAAEVVRATDSAVHGASAHWERKLAGTHTSERLTRVWAFSFTEKSSLLDAKREFPQGIKPSASDVEDVLATLEARGITQIGDWTDHTHPDQDSELVIPDPDIRRLHDLLGPMIWDTETVPIHDGRPGVFDIAFGYGSVGTMDADEIALDVEARLASDQFADVRSKLASSAGHERCAVVVFDDTTDAGYSLTALEYGETPRKPITLPPELTSVVIIDGPNLSLHFSAATGWRRFDP